MRPTLLRKPDLDVKGAARLWRRNASIYRRTYLFNVVPNFFEPFFYLLAMGLGLGAYLTNVEGIDYIDYIAPGLVATAALYGASFEVTFNCFVKMHFGKVYNAVATTPLTPEDIAFGEILWATTRALIYGTIFSMVAALFGVMHSPLALLLPVAIALTGLMFSVIGLTYCAIVPLIDYFSYYWTMYITPMFLFSGIFFPLDRMPEWLQTAAWFVPLHHAVDMMRALTLTGDLSRAAGSALWMLVLTLAMLVLPMNLMRRRLVQ